MVSQRYHRSITLSKKLLIALGIGLALSSCQEPVAVADKECQVYNVVTNTCKPDRDVEILLVEATQECFLVVYPPHQSINYPDALTIVKIDNRACYEN